MSDQEAIELLTQCLDLARRLESEELNYQPTPQDLQRLAGFKRVWQAGLAGYDHIRKNSGLSLNQLLWLAHLLARQENEQLRNKNK